MSFDQMSRAKTILICVKADKLAETGTFQKEMKS